MSILQSSNRPQGKRSPLGIIVGLVILLIIIGRFRSANRVSPPGKQTYHPPAAAKNPLESLFTPTTAIRRPGVAAAILLDTSGSMSETVDAGGRRQPKIDVARQSLVSLVRQSEQFAAAHPDKKIELALYEFSSRSHANVRQILPPGAPDTAKAEKAMAGVRAEGGTPIGDAIIRAKRDLDATGLSRQHILVITDGLNNQGYNPADVASAIGRLPEDARASLYLIAFDVAASQFNAVRDAGGLVLPAGNAQDLQQTLDYVLTGKILAEQPTQ